MKVLETHIQGLKIIEPDVFGDSRGYFFESFNHRRFNEYGIDFVFVQDNQSRSSKNVIRGLHMQKGEHAQTRLISTIAGSVLYVVVDLRPGRSYGKVLTRQVSEESKISLLVPKGVALGFSVLSDEAEVLFKCDGYFNRGAVTGIRYDDPQLAIDWKVEKSKAIISERDLALPYLSSFIP